MPDATEVRRRQGAEREQVLLDAILAAGSEGATMQGLARSLKWADRTFRGYVARLRESGRVQLENGRLHAVVTVHSGTAEPAAGPVREEAADHRATGGGGRARERPASPKTAEPARITWPDLFAAECRAFRDGQVATLRAGARVLEQLTEELALAHTATVLPDIAAVQTRTYTRPEAVKCVAALSAAGRKVAEAAAKESTSAEPPLTERLATRWRRGWGDTWTDQPPPADVGVRVRRLLVQLGCDPCGEDITAARAREAMAEAYRAGERAAMNAINAEVRRLEADRVAHRKAARPGPMRPLPPPKATATCGLCGALFDSAEVPPVHTVQCQGRLNRFAGRVREGRLDLDFDMPEATWAARIAVRAGHAADVPSALRGFAATAEGSRARLALLEQRDQENRQRQEHERALRAEAERQEAAQQQNAMMMALVLTHVFPQLSSPAGPASPPEVAAPGAAPSVPRGAEASRIPVSPAPAPKASATTPGNDAPAMSLRDMLRGLGART